MKAILIISLFLSLNLFGQELNIGIMRSYSVSKIQVSQLKGNYKVYGDSVEITTIWKDQIIYFQRSGEKVKVVKKDKNLGSFKIVTIQEIDYNSSFSIKCLLPSNHKSRKYMNNLIITPEGSDKLTVVNAVEMPNYLAGVVESEGGGGKHLEYYRVQAILSRTYALDHLHKHRKEGFQLCDKTHCQAYYNMMRYTSSINEAVTSTRGIIMISKELNLASGFFFANCGGQTSESDFVWNKPVGYCQSVQDTFCTHSKQAHWTKKISKSSWKSYLVNEFGFPVNDSIFGPLIYTFHQPQRLAFYLSPHLGIPLRDLRIKFKLKSTWFSCKPEGSQVILQGHGFGHGVGLCQEGAMRMAILGYNYKQILKFYFTGIELMNYYHWLFISQGGDTDFGL